MHERIYSFGAMAKARNRIDLAPEPGIRHFSPKTASPRDATLNTMSPHDAIISPQVALSLALLHYDIVCSAYNMTICIPITCCCYPVFRALCRLVGTGNLTGRRILLRSQSQSFQYPPHQRRQHVSVYGAPSCIDRAGLSSLLKMRISERGPPDFGLQTRP